jgi:hypothetical protein
MQAMAAFIRRHGIRADAEWADSNPNMDDMPAGSSHWRVTLRMGRKRMVVPFSQGPAIAREPEARDVLSCLASDAGSVRNARDFEDWAADYGYSPDSRKAERSYRVTVRQTERLAAFLGDLVDELLWETEQD